MAKPTFVEEVRRYLGMINYLVRLMLHMSKILCPLRNPTKEDVFYRDEIFPVFADFPAFCSQKTHP